MPIQPLFKVNQKTLFICYCLILDTSFTVRGGSISAGTSSEARCSSSTHRVHSGRVTKQNKANTPQRRRSGGGSSNASTSRSYTRNYARKTQSSPAHDESSWAFCKGYMMSSSSRRRRKPCSTVSDCSDLSHRSFDAPPGILKPQNSGPTCDMPVRFQLPDSSRVVYPSKACADDDTMETESDEEESMSQSSEQYDY